MIEDPEAIDTSMYDLTEWDNFEALTEKFNALLKNKERQVIIFMTFIEWATYTSYTSHALDLDDDLTSKEEAVIVSLTAENHDILKANASSS